MRGFLFRNVDQLGSILGSTIWVGFSILLVYLNSEVSNGISFIFYFLEGFLDNLESLSQSIIPSINLNFQPGNDFVEQLFKSKIFKFRFRRVLEIFANILVW